MTDLAEAGAGVDVVLVSDALARADGLEQAGGLAYLAGLTDGLPRATNVAHYASIVKDRAALRRVIQLANEAMTRAYDAADSAGTIIGSLGDELLKLGLTASRSGFRAMAELVPEAYQRAEVRSRREVCDPGISSGLRDLDRLTGGFRPGNLVIVAARPGLGKTSLCLNIAAHAALRLGKRVAIFSLEMSEAGSSRGSST
jgi:replicative DNA helicase